MVGGGRGRKQGTSPAFSELLCSCSGHGRLLPSDGVDDPGVDPSQTSTEHEHSTCSNLAECSVYEWTLPSHMPLSLVAACQLFRRTFLPPNVHLSQLQAK